MPTGPRLLIEDACYHIIIRGNHKQTTFFDKNDYEFYLSRIRMYKYRFAFSLYGFCLMPNHIHLLGEPRETHCLSKFMHGLSRSYTNYFNQRYDKVGQLWQGRFKSKVILKDRYFIDCLQYIENNPVRANIVKSPVDYVWSSYRERILFKKENLVLSPLRL
jgi:putative transposase